MRVTKQAAGSLVGCVLLLFAAGASSAAGASAAGKDPAGVRTGPLTWSGPSHVDDVGGLSSVSCPTLHFCEAVDGQGHAFRWGGGGWGQPKVVDTNPGGSDLNSSLDSISCTDPSFCIAVDQGGAALRWDGSGWTKPVSLYENQYLNWTAVSCATRTACLVVGDASDFGWWDGRRWTVETVGNGLQFSSVSCPNAHFCMAVSGDDALTWNGSKWVSAVDVDPTGVTTLYSVSCPTTRFCMAAGGEVYIWDGGSWEQTSQGGLEAVSCAGPRLCVGVDSSGDAIVWDAGRWLPAAQVDPAGAELGNLSITVTCNRFELCAAVSAAGNAEIARA